MNRSPRRAPTLALALLLSLAGTGSALAQSIPVEAGANLAQGLAGGSAWSSPGTGEASVDRVNLFNGSLRVALPLGPRYPVRGGGAWGLTLVYNGKLWDWEAVQGLQGGDQVQPDARFNAGLGWRLSLGELYSPWDARNDTGGWVYVSPDGATHRFHGQRTSGEPETPGALYTQDGSSLRLRPSLRLVEHPDGSTESFDGQGRLVVRRGPSPSGQIGGGPVRVTVTYGATSWQLTDAEGRVATVHLRNAPFYGAWSTIDRVELPRFGGGIGPSAQTAVWRFEYDEEAISVGCPHNLPDPPAWVTVPLLTGVVRPDGARWEPEQRRIGGVGGSCDNLSGVLDALDLPTGGRLEWDWGGRTFPVPAQRCRSAFTASAGVAARRELDLDGRLLGEWQYNAHLPGPQAVCGGSYPLDPAALPKELQVTVIDPLGHKRRTHFSVAHEDDAAGWRRAEYGLPASHAEHFGGRALAERVIDASGQVLRSRYRTWAWDGLGDGGAQHPRVRSEAMILHDDGSRWWSIERSDWDGVGRYRRELTNGNFGVANGNSGNGGGDRVTRYRNTQAGGIPGLNDPWVLGLWDEAWIEEDGLRHRTQACFDESTGVRLRARSLAGASPGPHDVLWVGTPDGDHQLIREAVYGGDIQAISTSSDLCGLPLPGASQWSVAHTWRHGSLATSTVLFPDGSPVPHQSVDRTLDPATGLPSAERDPSGLAVHQVWDPLGRLVETAPPAGEGAKVVTRYPLATGPGSPARVITEVVSQEGAGVLDRTEAWLDGLGRPVRERRRGPSGAWQDRYTSWDGSGNRSAESFWGTFTGVRWEDFDPFGRPETFVPPEGRSRATTVTWQGERRKVVRSRVGSVELPDGSTGEAVAETAYLYDRQGRLVRLDEPAVGGVVDRTDYAYDPSGNLIRVVQGHLDQGQQVREWGYDGRGFRLWERTPELAGGFATFEGYHPRGYPTRTRRGPWDLTHRYDRLGRLLAIEETGSGRPWKEWSWAWSNGGTAATGRPNRRAGALWQTTRHNWVVPPWGSQVIDVAVTETTEYGGRGGAASRVDTTLLDLHFRWEGTWDEEGRLARQSLPRCLHATCTSTPHALRSVDALYQHGWLTELRDGFTSRGRFDYHPSGLVSRIEHGNGVVDTIDGDPTGRPRVHRISTAGASHNFFSGFHRYDADGRLLEAGPDRYRYDPRGRLVASHQRLEGTDHGRTYTWDRWGNLQSRTEQVGSGSPITRTTPTISSTNRLSGAGYDSAGQMVSWSGMAFAYDPFGLTWSTPGAVHVYGPRDQRLWIVEHSGGTLTGERFTLRGLAGERLTEYRVTGGNAAGNWTWERDLIWRGGLPLAAVARTGVEHYHLDALGSVRRVTDAAGFAFGRHGYLPFGTEATSPGQHDGRTRFAAYERDPGSLGGLDTFDYLHARFYSPWLARFTSPDPLTGHREVPGSWNRYAYALGDPVNRIDPYGYESLPIFEDEITVTAETDGGLDDLQQGAQLWYAIQDLNRLDYLPTPLHDMAFSDILAAAQVAGVGGECLDPLCLRLKDIAEHNNTVQWIVAGVAEVVNWGTPLPPGFFLARVGGRGVTRFAATTGVKKAVNSGLPHAVNRGVQRGVFQTKEEAGRVLREVSKQITTIGDFPPGTVVDSSRAGRYLVPVGEKGLAVYQLNQNGTARLKTVLNAR